MTAGGRREDPCATVHAALMDTARAAPPASRMLPRLSPAERQRYSEFRRKPAAQQYLASRWLLRTHIGALLRIPSRNVELSYPRGAAPRLPCSDWRIGLSHSNGVVFCTAASGVAVGCDVEHHRPRARLSRIAASCFTEQEASHLQELDKDRLGTDFYRLWTLKEAGKKALGLGLSSGLSRPAFEWSPALSCQTAPGPGPWVFAWTRLVSEGETYSLSLALNGPHVAVDALKYDFHSELVRPVPVPVSWTFVRS